jgi:stearoyl-CoA desaturase (delta-9 desaturase)
VRFAGPRDSFLLATFTFDEGYHNYHHEFPSDYRNGVKPWQFDPTKWLIWILAKFGITSSLRRVPREKIAAAEQAVNIKLSNEDMSAISSRLSVSSTENQPLPS